MEYRVISADCHIDLPWLPPDLFTAGARKALKARMPYAAERRALKQRDPAMTADSIRSLLRDTLVSTGRVTSINACRALERLVNGRGVISVTNRCPSAQ